MKFTLIMDLDNDHFVANEDADADEVMTNGIIWCLDQAAKRIQDGYADPANGIVIDYNGNYVGSYGTAD